MSHVPPRDPEELGSLGPMLDAVKATMGFVPNSMLTMAHLPIAFSMLAVIALFGFLNRWNDTLATALEAEPLAFAADHLAAVDWLPGKHGGTPQQG